MIKVEITKWVLKVQPILLNSNYDYTSTFKNTSLRHDLDGSYFYIEFETNEEETFFTLQFL